jgi:hypothetical protein
MDFFLIFMHFFLIFMILKFLKKNFENSPFIHFDESGWHFNKPFDFKNPFKEKNLIYFL